MNFTVRYRGASGVVAQEVVAAANRADVFAEMKARGITPISVAEGGELKASAAAPGPSRGLVKGLVAGLVVVVLAVAAWFFLARPAPEPKPAPAPKPRASVRPAAVHPATNRVAKAPAAPKLPTPPPNIKGRRAYKEWFRSQMTPEEREAFDKAELERSTVANFRITKEEFKGRFWNPVQQELQCFAEPGRDMPPVGHIDDQAAYHACVEGVEYKDTDTEKDLEIKRTVAAMLVELKQWLKDGKTADEYFHELQKRQASEADLVQQVRANIRDTKEKEGAAAAREDLEVYNKILKEKGIAPLQIKGVNKKRMNKE